MALRTRDRSTPDAPAGSGRQRLPHRVQPIMERTVLGARDPEGNRVMLKAGTPTPDWYTGRGDGRDAAQAATVASVARAEAASHPAEQPMPEGEAMEAYLRGLEDAAAATGERPPIEYDTAAAREAVNRGLDRYGIEQELAALTDDERAELEALSPDDQALLAALDDEGREALAALDTAAQASTALDAVLEGVWDSLTDDERVALAEADLSDEDLDALLRIPADERQAFVEAFAAAVPEGTEPAPLPDPNDPGEQALVEGSVDTVLARIGDDLALAQRALRAEQARGDRARSTLTDELTKRLA